MRGWGATVVVLLVCGGTPVVHAQGTDTSVALTQWQARWTDLTTNVLLDPDDAPGWEPMTLPGRVTPAGDVLWLRTRLPEGAWKQPALRIDSVIGNNEIYLDDTLLLARPAQGLAGPTTTGVPWLLINLPQDLFRASAHHPGAHHLPPRRRARRPHAGRTRRAPGPWSMAPRGWWWDF